MHRQKKVLELKTAIDVLLMVGKVDRSAKDRKRATPLHHAAKGGNPITVKALLDHECSSLRLERRREKRSSLMSHGGRRDKSARLARRCQNLTHAAGVRRIVERAWWLSKTHKSTAIEVSDAPSLEQVVAMSLLAAIIRTLMDQHGRAELVPDCH